jgi:hypothetical protein
MNSFFKSSKVSNNKNIISDNHDDSNSNVSKFNGLITQFLNDLKKIDPLSNELKMVETYANIIHITSSNRIIISNFQAFVLKDNFIVNILKKNVVFFINYKFDDDVNIKNVKSNYVKPLILRVQDIVNQLYLKGESSNIESIFNWLIMLSYFAYLDLGINPDEKFKSVQEEEVTEI